MNMKNVTTADYLAIAGRVRNPSKKVFMLIEVFPFGRPQGNLGEQPVGAEVAEGRLGDIDKDAFPHKMSNNGVTDIKFNGTTLFFEILPEDFFLANREGLEAYLHDPLGFSHTVLFSGPADGQIQNIPGYADGGEQKAKPCIRLSLLPVPYPIECGTGNHEIARGHFWDAFDRVKNFFKHKSF
jgi:hypothetical protein